VAAKTKYKPADDLTLGAALRFTEYIAPEVIAAQGHTAAVDWWTLGILIYEMIYATTPFKGHERNDTFHNIRYQTVQFRDTPKISR
jgi:protein-serine/threonine kinase